MSKQVNDQKSQQRFKIDNECYKSNTKVIVTEVFLFAAKYAA
jgi:hypothetical protein